MKVRYFLLFFLFLCGCEANVFRPKAVLQSLSLKKVYPFQGIKDAVYIGQDSTLVLLAPYTSELIFYKNNAVSNKVGGPGFGHNNFQKLAAFCLTRENNLLVLDSSKKNLSVFNAKGDFLSSSPLTELVQPSLIATDAKQTAYICDTVKKQITPYDLSTLEQGEAFGRFELKEPKYISCRQNEIYLIDGETTKIYNDLGRLVTTYPTAIYYDNYGNGISVEKRILKTNDKILIMCPEDVYAIRFYYDRCFIIANSGVYEYTLKYDFSQNP